MNSKVLIITASHRPSLWYWVRTVGINMDSWFLIIYRWTDTVISSVVCDTCVNIYTYIYFLALCAEKA